MSIPRQYSFLPALGVAAGLLAIGCQGQSGNGGGPGGGGGRGDGRGGRGGAAIQVQTAALQRISVERRVDLSGTLTSPDQAKVSSEVAGVVREVPVELGSEVKVGSPLVRVEPRELALALERAESALRQVEAQLGIDRSQDRQPPPDEKIASVQQAIANRDDARAAYRRAEQLSADGLVSKVDRETAETRLKVADANLQAALDNVRSLKASLQDRRASFELAQKKLNDATVRAPVAGSIAERLVQAGEYIRENTPVATIVQVNPLKLRTAIQEKYAGNIRPGQPVDFIVEAFPEKMYRGKVAFVSPAVDQTTRTFPVEVLVENPDRQLKPGFFAKGSVLVRLDEDVLAAPDDAISTLAGVSTVYVIEEGKAKQQQVTLGAHQGKVTEIVEGLKGAEAVAVTNVNQLATGTSVRIGSGPGGEGRGERGGQYGRAGRGREGANQ